METVLQTNTEMGWITQECVSFRSPSLCLNHRPGTERTQHLQHAQLLKNTLYKNMNVLREHFTSHGHYLWHFCVV